MNRILKKSFKFILYIASRVLGVAVVLWLAYNCFITALNTMNINMIVKDAFTKRASVILDLIENKDTALLEKVFTRDYLDRSKLDTQTDNRFYDVSMYMQRTDVKLKLVFPKQEEAEIIVKDIVDDIRAELANEDDPAFVEKDSLISSGEYSVKVIKTNSGWIIDDINLIEEITPEYIRPLPTREPEKVRMIEEEEEDIPEEDIEETDGEEA
ncbi:MAG: hypothetical protein IKK29_02645 [Christensenellaceae bacterium]|nr:hypothetical protein [Christensenellaceae bacterium]